MHGRRELSPACLLESVPTIYLTEPCRFATRAPWSTKAKDLHGETTYAPSSDMNKKNGRGGCWAEVEDNRRHPHIQISLDGGSESKKGVPTRPPSTPTASALDYAKTRRARACTTPMASLLNRKACKIRTRRASPNTGPPLKKQGSGSPTKEGAEQAQVGRMLGEGEGVTGAGRTVLCTGAEALEALGADWWD